ncbi:hypothetical protein PSHT_05193 [Puccinia striiformis]|uniref:Uncharacterized protein n=2 Tax=Puccinia striiformis TaxID=27350 RepID=A0A0L0V0Z5_9BASI|nr:hypothetical protein PSTG_13772 [Puccinia striiformis f. sp. tritici PST-78]POW19009.1 hypothetical protein PSHT_05193 [Puccinia striiformis]
MTLLILGDQDTLSGNTVRPSCQYWQSNLLKLIHTAIACTSTRKRQLVVYLPKLTIHYHCCLSKKSKTKSPQDLIKTIKDSYNKLEKNPSVDVTKQVEPLKFVEPYY